LGRRPILGLSHPYTYAQPHHQAKAIVKIITNETTRALNLLIKQSPKMHNAIYQNCLALDDLLASDSVGNCCLQVDNERKVIEEVTDRMRKLTHVPVQT
jgi:hypothetical protein